MTHPIPVGARVVILSPTISGPPRPEGEAVIVGVARNPNSYRVQFVGDPVLRERVVHPDYQSDPERFLQILGDLWEAGRNLSADFSDFFPDENLAAEDE